MNDGSINKGIVGCAPTKSIRHELSAVASGLNSLLLNLQVKYPASEKEKRILDSCVQRISKVLQRLDQQKII